MKATKAIEILTSEHRKSHIAFRPDLEDAIKLGIEALKRLQANRLDPEFDHYLPLPGETPEDD